MAATGEHEMAATVAVKLGPVRARFNGRVRMEDVRPGEGCTLQFEGQGGAAGMARGASSVALHDEPGGTRVSYRTQASVAGKLGQVGGRMIDAAARQMADQFFAAFQAELAPVPAEAAEAAPEGLPEGTPASAPAAPAVPAAPGTAPSAAPPPAAAAARSHPAAPAPPPSGEASRVLWFVLGALSTGFGVWLGRVLFS
jgi:hypothetical protein